MLNSVGFMSINQMAAYGLLIEYWKAKEFGVPFLEDLLERKRSDQRTLRSDTTKKVSSTGRDIVARNLERLWNLSSERFKGTNILKVARITKALA